MARRNSQNTVQSWITTGAGAAIIGYLTLIGAIGGAGYSIGWFVTKSEWQDKVNEMRFQHQEELTKKKEETYKEVEEKFKGDVEYYKNLWLAITSERKNSTTQKERSNNAK